MKKFTFALVTVSVLALTGCVTQKQADDKMGEGCKAALTVVMDPKTIENVKNISYADENTEGSVYRRVTVQLVEKDGLADLDQTYSCLFSQDWGFMKSTHTALLEQVSAGDKFIGKKDGQLVGSMEEFMNLTSKVSTAMTQQ